LDFSDETAQRGLVQRMRRYLYNDLVNSYREELDQLTSQAHQQIKQEIERTLDLAVAHSEERVNAIIEELAKPFRAREQKALEKFTEDLIEQRRQQFDLLIQTALQDAGLRLKNAYGVIEHDADATVERAREACSDEVDKASNSIAKAGSIVNLMLESGAARIAEVSRQSEADFERAADQQRTRLGELSAPSLEEFRRQADAIAAGLRDNADASLRGSLERASAEFAAQVDGRARELLAVWSERFRNEAENAATRLNEQIETSAGAVAEQNERRRESMAAALRQHASDAVEGFRQGLQSTLREQAESGARDLEARFEEVEHRHFAVIREQLAAEIEEMGARSISEARTRLDQSCREISDLVNQQIGAATLALQTLASQAEQRLEASAKRSLDDLHAKMVSLADANLGELRSEASSVTEGARGRLLGAARALGAADTEEREGATAAPGRPAGMPDGSAAA